MRRVCASLSHRSQQTLTSPPQFISLIDKSAARFFGAIPGTWLSVHIQLLVGFSVTGLAHVPGDMMVHPYWTGSS